MSHSVYEHAQKARCLYGAILATRAMIGDLTAYRYTETVYRESGPTPYQRGRGCCKYKDRDRPPCQSPNVNT